MSRLNFVKGKKSSMITLPSSSSPPKSSTAKSERFRGSLKAPRRHLRTNMKSERMKPHPLVFIWAGLKNMTL